MINVIEGSVPWAQTEQIDIPSGGRKLTERSRWQNATALPIHLRYLLVDSNDVTTASIRFGIRGKRQLVDNFVSTRALFNYRQVANQATDGAWPLWNFERGVRLPRKQTIAVELQDFVNNGDRVVNVCLYCSKKRASGPCEFLVLTDRVTLPDGGETLAQLETDETDELVAHGFSLYIEETGSVANIRGIGVRVRNGAMPDWMDRRIRASVLFPHSNPGASICRLPENTVLEPGQIFEAEVLDSSPTNTIYLGVVGHAQDRRSL